MRGRHFHRNDSESGKYTVEIDRGEKGGVKTIKFRSRDAALALADVLSRGKSKVRVLNPRGQEIYSRQ